LVHAWPYESLENVASFKGGRTEPAPERSTVARGEVIIVVETDLTKAARQQHLWGYGSNVALSEQSFGGLEPAGTSDGIVVQKGHDFSTGRG
jgi:hypothetical protein